MHMLFVFLTIILLNFDIKIQITVYIYIYINRWMSIQCLPGYNKRELSKFLDFLYLKLN